jgi:hypothetical protein
MPETNYTLSHGTLYKKKTSRRELIQLVPCPINSMAFVAIKMGCRSGSCRTRGGRISESIRNRSRGCRTKAMLFMGQGTSSPLLNRNDLFFHLNCSPNLVWVASGIPASFSSSLKFNFRIHCLGRRKNPSIADRSPHLHIRAEDPEEIGSRGTSGPELSRCRVDYSTYGRNSTAVT